MNSAIKIILIEDEPYNLRLLEGMIRKLRPEWEIAATFESAKSSVEWLKKHTHPDLFFMDIQLADGLCFSIFDQVQVDSMVIFTTAYDDYAIRAFKVNSIDYLLKPFKERDLEAAILKFENLRPVNRTETNLPDYDDIREAIRKGEKKFRRRFLVSKGVAYYTLQAAEIAYFHSTNRTTTAVTFAGQNHVVDFALDVLEEQLNPEEFFRANRQIVVNIRAIVKIENHFGGKLKLVLNPPVMDDHFVSRLKAASLKEWLGR
jgi:DNA-binding LytR/AlgR family response regulator